VNSAESLTTATLNQAILSLPRALPSADAAAVSLSLRCADPLLGFQAAGHDA
jgi:hypothetical protein